MELWVLALSMKGRQLKITRLDTGEKFESIKEASEKMYVSHSTIKNAHHNKRESICGIPIRFEDEAYTRSKPVICVETKERFESASEAARAIGRRPQNITFAIGENPVGITGNGKDKGE